jgi:hypothetical protein
MQSSIIPWHIFLNALAKQSCSNDNHWLGRWRFTNDGVLDHEAINARHEFHLPDGSIRSSGKEEQFIN